MLLQKNKKLLISLSNLIYLLNPLKTLYFQGVSPVLCANLMYFPLFLPLRAEIQVPSLSSACNKLSAFENEIYPLNRWEWLKNAYISRIFHSNINDVGKIVVQKIFRSRFISPR